MVEKASKPPSEELKQFFNRPVEFVTGWRHCVPPGYWCPWHKHDVMEIVYHPTGTGQTNIQSSGKRIDFVDGSVVIYPPAAVHDQILSTPGEDVCIHLRSTQPFPHPLKECLYLPALTDPYLKAELNFQRYHPSVSDLERLSLSHRFTAVLLQLVQNPELQTTSAGQTSSTDMAERYAVGARQYIREHFQEIAKLEEVARHAGVSHDYLRHVFKAKYGISLARCLNQVRIERARELLQRSELPLKAIADLCGFENERYFSHVFRTFERSPPGTYRMKARAR